MATTIKLKNGSGAPLAGDLVQGEPAFDLTNKRLYTEDSGGSVIEVGTNPTSLTTGTFTSTGIDDNATSTAITIDSNGQIMIAGSTTAFDTTAAVNGLQAYYETDTGLATLGSYSSGGSTLMTFHTSSGGGASAEAMRIDSSGNVMIGATSTTKNFLVENPSTASGEDVSFRIKTNGTGSDADAIFEMIASTTGECLINFGDENDANIGNIRYDHNINAMRFITNTNEAVRIDSSGNVGIGTTSPNRLFEVAGNNNAGAKANYLRITDTDTTATAANQQGGIEFYASDASAGAGVTASIEVVYAGSGAGGEITFNTAANSGTGISEAMRIDETGNLLVGTTETTVNTTNFGTRISSTVPGYLASYRDVTGSSVAVLFGGNAGQVYIRGDGDLENTNNNYGSISDERLKSDIIDASSQIDDIMAVQVRSYTLNETGATHIGVVAQELEASGMSGLVKTDEEGMKSVKYSILYMKAIKALQEAVTRIETLEAEVAALKGE